MDAIRLCTNADASIAGPVLMGQYDKLPTTIGALHHFNTLIQIVLNGIILNYNLPIQIVLYDITYNLLIQIVSYDDIYMLTPNYLH